MTNLELVRKKLADEYKFASDTNIGDGGTSIFKLAHSNIQDETYTIYVDLSESDNYEIDLERGLITFNTPPADEKNITAQYYFSAFSDDEIEYFLEENENDINETLIDLIEILLIDSARRFDYSTGQSEMKPSQVFKNLKEMLIFFSKKVPAEVKSNLKQGTLSSPYYQSEVKPSKDLSRYDEWE